MTGGNLSPDDWRICVDFGTAASKAAIGSQSGWRNGGAPVVKPLALGHFAGNTDPLIVPSAVFVENGKIYFGPIAIERARSAGAEREPLQSFKMWLSARDLPSLLESFARRTIDATGRLTNKAILTLYAGYLGALVRAALASDPKFAAMQSAIPWRYSRPDWPGVRAAQHDLLVKRLFETGLFMAERLRDEYMGVSGLDIDRALAVLESAPRETSGIVEGGVLEAHAAAAAHITASAASSPIMMVVDIGAGTTDFDGFQLKTQSVGQIEMHRIVGAKRTLNEAGDQVDLILMNAVLDNAGLGKNPKAQDALWRTMSSSIRELKRQAFVNEKCAVRFNDKAIVLTKARIESLQEFKDFVAKIKDQFEDSLTQASMLAKSEKSESVSLILSGGGANLPFIQVMAAQAQKSWRKGARVRLEPPAPAWVHQGEFASGLAPLFQQLAVAIGGTSPLIRSEQLLVSRL